MKTSEIWGFRLESGARCLLRVVLALKDLNLHPEQFLAFIGDWLLIQISKHSDLRDDSFEKQNLLLDGVLVWKYRNATKLGFEKIGEKKVCVEEVEFPGWFANDQHTAFFFRGEVEYPVQGYDFVYIHEHWRILLSANLPKLKNLAWYLSDYYTYLEAAAKGQVKKGIGVYSADVRYNVKKDEILSAIGVSFEEPYYKVLAANAGDDRLNAYEAALDPAIKRTVKQNRSK
jgi:hypothetical protein